MRKADKIVEILERGEWLFNSEIAEGAVSSSARVCQVINDLEAEGRTVLVDYVGHRAKYRLLSREEVKQHKADQQRAAAERLARQKLAAAETALRELRDAIDRLSAA